MSSIKQLSSLNKNHIFRENTFSYFLCKGGAISGHLVAYIILGWSQGGRGCLILSFIAFLYDNFKNVPNFSGSEGRPGPNTSPKRGICPPAPQKNVCQVVLLILLIQSAITDTKSVFQITYLISYYKLYFSSENFNKWVESNKRPD